MKYWLALMLAGVSGAVGASTPPEDRVYIILTPIETAPNVERYISFAAPNRCGPSAAFDALLWAMLPTDGTQMIEPPVPDLPMSFAKVAPSLQLTRTEGGLRQATLQMNHKWHGLRLIQIARWMGNNLDAEGFTLEFANSEEEVRAVLDRMGFALPDEGAKQIGKELPLSIRVIPIAGGRTMLSCGTEGI